MLPALRCFLYRRPPLATTGVSVPPNCLHNAGTPLLGTLKDSSRNGAIANAARHAFCFESQVQLCRSA